MSKLGNILVCLTIAGTAAVSLASNKGDANRPRIPIEECLKAIRGDSVEFEIPATLLTTSEISPEDANLTAKMDLSSGITNVQIKLPLDRDGKPDEAASIKTLQRIYIAYRKVDFEFPIPRIRLEMMDIRQISENFFIVFALQKTEVDLLFLKSLFKAVKLPANSLGSEGSALAAIHFYTMLYVKLSNDSTSILPGPFHVERERLFGLLTAELEKYGGEIEFLKAKVRGEDVTLENLAAIDESENQKNYFKHIYQLIGREHANREQFGADEHILKMIQDLYELFKLKTGLSD